MIQDIDDLEIGSSRLKAIIKEVEVRKVTAKNNDPEVPVREFEKLFLKAEDSNGGTYLINEAWVKSTHKNTVEAKGMWIRRDETSKKLFGGSGSLLVQLLNSLNATKFSELVGKEITIEPKDNNFMAVVLYN